jgi:acyl-coenzyme A synthetase/AMP-(fatty) acid ligase
VSLLHRIRERAEGAAFAARVLRSTGLAGAMRLGGVAPFLRDVRSTKLGPHLAVMLHARMSPNKEALVDGARRWTWRELDGEINRLAHAIVERGGSGAPVACMLGNGAEYVMAQQALARIGATAVQVGYRSKAAEVAYNLDNAEPKVAIVGEAFADTFLAAQELATTGVKARVIVAGGALWDDALAPYPTDTPPVVGAHDGGGVIVYTSGTTGKPKGAARNF